MNLKLIRGEKILKILNEESTYSQLYTNIQTAFPDTKKRQHEAPKVNITNFKYIPFQSKNILQIKTTAVSGGNQYSPVIQFSNVNYNTGGRGVTFTAVDGSEYTIEPIRLSQNTVKVRCDCLDFHYRFATWNYNDESLIGKPPPLYRKKTNRPPVNPAQVPGLCKHLVKFFTVLRRYRIVT